VTKASKEGRDKGEKSTARSNKIIAFLGVLTAALTLATATLGVLGAQAEQERSKAQAEASSLSTEVSDLSATISALESERDSMLDEIEELEQQRDSLRTSLEEATQDSGGGVEVSQEGEVAGGPVANSTYLVDLEPVDAYVEAESREVHGRQVLRSIVQGLSCPTALEWNLGGRYAEFTTWAGLDDESRNRDARARFTVIGDGVVLHEVVLGLTQHEEFEVDIEGVFRLVLEMELISPDRCFYHADGVWGDPVLHLNNS
jgi:HAMP domain-containing protein